MDNYQFVQIIVIQSGNTHNFSSDLDTHTGRAFHYSHYMFDLTMSNKIGNNIDSILRQSCVPSKDEKAASVPETREISEYEKIRAQNIERNNAKLRALGLLSAQEEKKSNDAAWRRTSSQIAKPSISNSNKNKRKENDTRPTRCSKRIRGIIDRQGMDTKIMKGEAKDEEEINREREAIVAECREARMRVAVEVAKQDPDGASAAIKNRTATYEHCLMRVRTMNHKGLINRVKAIERAAGKHSVIKMAIFKCCLQDEGYWDLAEMASSALERLKALQPPPSSVDI